MREKTYFRKQFLFLLVKFLTGLITYLTVILMVLQEKDLQSYVLTSHTYHLCGSCIRV